MNCGRRGNNIYNRRYGQKYGHFGAILEINISRNPRSCLMMFIIIIIIIGVVPLRGFPVGRRGIGCRVPILGGRRLAGLVRLVGRARPSRCCQAGMAVQLVGPAPTPHGAQAVGRHSQQDVAQPLVPPRPHSRQKVVRMCGGLLSIRPPGDEDTFICSMFSPLTCNIRRYIHSSADSILLSSVVFRVQPASP